MLVATFVATTGAGVAISEAAGGADALPKCFKKSEAPNNNTVKNISARRNFGLMIYFYDKQKTKPGKARLGFDWKSYKLISPTTKGNTAR
jgi:hypothetical protein